MPFETVEGLHYHIPQKGYSQRPYTAAFDVDWTVTHSERHLFPKDEDDIFLMPNRLEKLQEFYDKNFNIVFITNQSCKTKHEKEKRADRMQTLIDMLPFPCYLFMSTENDQYRKPNIGMWKKVEELIPDMKAAFFCGDASGRPQDFSDSDRLFAENAKIKFYTPEEIFPETQVEFTGEREMVIFVGMPGSGKSTFYQDRLAPKGYVHINQDTLKTKAKVMKTTEETLQSGKSLVIDATNPTLEGRRVFFNMANQYKYTITVVYLIRDGRGWNNLRETKVPDIVYHIYFKKLESPTAKNTPGKVYRVC